MGSSGPRILAGAMSGTSADGVDVALVRIDGRGLEMKPQLLRHQHRGYDAELRASIFAARSGEGAIKLADLAQLARRISLTYATAVNESLVGAKLTAPEVTAIAAHGQTLYHSPPATIQWLDPALLAYETGSAVVSDFRRADCAAGGQGAPLVPFADFILFRHPEKNRVLLNIGGIANLTYLPAGGALEDVRAFDTGPGNCVSDWICRTFGPLEMSCDTDGMGASRGLVKQELFDAYLRQPYFRRPPPKSTDGPAMIEPFREAMGKTEYEMDDLLATATCLTARTVRESIDAVAQANPIELRVSGGGTRNRAIMTWLRSLLDDSIDLKLVDYSDAKEAVAFALLGAATLDGVPANVPSATGARQAVVLGAVTPKP
jgi:anhydro-N-acetylmuramic acid kinase